MGPDKCNDTIPSTDWDLSEIWYATSEDGFTWEEQGVAIPRPPKPNVGWRSVSTADILKWKGKYYMYYQGFMEASGKRGDYCPVAVSYARITSYNVCYTKLLRRMMPLVSLLLLLMSCEQEINQMSLNRNNFV